MGIKFLALTLSLITVACKTLSAGDSAVLAYEFPLDSCANAWKTLIPEHEYSYNFATETKLTEYGNEGYDLYRSRTDRTDCFKDWTVLIYMDADSQLMPFAIRDLYEMEAGADSQELTGSSLKADVIVQLASSNSPKARRLHMFQQPKPFQKVSIDAFMTLSEQDVRSPIAELVQENKGPAGKNLESFLEWGMTKYPAKHYMVVIWGYGQAWTAIMPEDGDVVYDIELLDMGDFPKFGGRSSDFENNPDDPFKGRSGSLFFGETGDQSVGYLPLPALRAALNNVVDKVLAGKKIDILAADAGLLQMVEVAAELKETSAYFVGTANTQHFVGFPFRRMLSELNSKSDVEPQSLAQMIPQLQTTDDVLTASAFSSQALRIALEPALSRLGQALLDYIKEKPDLVPMRARNFRYLLQEAPTYQGGASEMGTFLGLMDLMLAREADADGMSEKSAKLTKEIAVTRKVLLASVIGYSYGSLYKSVESKQHLSGFRAVSMWLPRSIFEYSDRIDDFRKSVFYKKLDRPDGTNPWVDLFDEVFNADEPIIEYDQEG